MRWILAFHIIAIVAWFAGLFYLPRLFVYHADSSDTISDERFKIMERKLYRYIMTPAGILTTLLGLWLLGGAFRGYLSQHWMQLKLILVVLLWVYHLYCGRIVQHFKQNRNLYSSKFFRFFNEIPTILLIGIVIAVIVKPGF